MKSIIAFLIALSFASNMNSQLTLVPDTMKRGTINTILFSGSAVNFWNDPCIQVVFFQGSSNMIYQSASNFFTSSNTFITSFYVASNAIVDTYSVMFYNICTGSTVNTFANKMKLKYTSSIQKFLEKIELMIFPNPVKQGEELEILANENLQNKNSVCIYSIDGKLVQTIHHINYQDKIPTNNLKPGNYFLEFSNQNGVKSSKKLVVE